MINSWYIYIWKPYSRDNKYQNIERICYGIPWSFTPIFICLGKCKLISCYIPATWRLISRKESNAKSRSHRQVQRARDVFGISHTAGVAYGGH